MSRAFLLMLLAVGATVAANDVVVLLDNSGSMRENDPDRLLKPAVIELIQRLPEDLRISVVSFDSEPKALIGLSDRRVDLERALESIQYQGQLTDTPAAVERALYELRSRGRASASRNILLITDGIVDLGDVAASRRAEDWLTGALVNQAIQDGIAIHAIAFTEGADYRILQGVTEATGGNYYRAADIDELRAVLDEIRIVLARDLAVGERELAIGLKQAAVPDIRPVITITRHAPAMVPPPGPTAETPVIPIASESTLRWWVVSLAMFAMVGVAGGAVALTIFLHQRRVSVTPRARSKRLEYFPECYLVDLDGVTPSTRHELKSKSNIISRLKTPPDDGMNYIYIPRPNIGRRHAMIEYRNLTFWIKDLSSMNGTRLNGRRVSTEQRLKHGDRIKFHTYEFEFSVSDLAYSTGTEPAWQS